MEEHLYILRPAQLTDRHKEDLWDLVEDCRRAEPISLSIPEDADRYLLLYAHPDSRAADSPADSSQGGSGRGAAVCLAACLLICETPDDVWECYAFTRPDSRRKGYFSRLAEEACRMADEVGDATDRPVDLAFLSDQKSPQGLAAVQALELTLWYAEYQMERYIGQSPDDLDVPEPRPLKQRRLHLQRETIWEEQDGDRLESWLFSAYPVAAEDPVLTTGPTLAAGLSHALHESPIGACAASPIGTCRLLRHGPSCFYLYHVEIREDMRSKGWGRAFLDALFHQLPTGSRLLLQVSSLNEPALALYKKTGFRITETLSYYLF